MICKVVAEIFIIQATDLKYGVLLGGWKLAIKCKISAQYLQLGQKYRPKT